MKNFIISNGDALMDISTCLLMFGVIIIGIINLFVGNINIFGCVGIILFGTWLVILSVYMYYCIIDIKDSLKEIASNTKKESEE